MSHVTGTVQIVATVIEVGPDSDLPADAPNTWIHNFAHTPAPGGTKFLILHFRNANLPASNRLEVDLGYGTDIFTAADGDEFWTRPINLHVLTGGLVPIRYITDGAANGSVELDKYGRGERHEEDPELAGEPEFQSFSNCDPFLPDSSYLEPTYATAGLCGGTPNWENTKCVTPPSDIRNTVAAAVGMIVSVHGQFVSTCTVTLIAPDRVITAGHCVADPSEEIFTSSVTFDYAVNCNGNRPQGYDARFHKVKKVIKFRSKTIDSDYYDYCILEIAVPPGGLGIIPVPMRTDLPALGEEVFGIHHPNGAVKKLSVPHPGFAAVDSSEPGGIVVDLDIAGGSSGSGLFDASGQIVGVLSHGLECAFSYFPTATILVDLNAAPEPPATRDVMIVFDRSGSMSLDAGTGLTKITEARDAASLFVQLVRAATGNRVGLVSFSSTASAPVDFALADATDANKLTLIGPAPFSGGIVGGLTPGGSTTIGGGLQSAQMQFPAPGANPRSILLLTDGLQNTPPMIDQVMGLDGIDLNVIGYGTEASLDGKLLKDLAQAHNGLYTRAMSPLHLKKFFALAFGNIFETGAAVDPDYFLPKEEKAKPVPFHICGEDNVTLVIGWDRADALLLVQVRSPLGATIHGGSPGVEQAIGRTWSFLRFRLPYSGERDGEWHFEVLRGDGDEEHPRRPVDVRYFVNVIVDGGPRLAVMPSKRKLYTGDAINPLVALKYRDGTFPHHARMQVTVSKPDAAIGDILTRSGLRKPTTLDADTIPARQATLLALETESGKPAVGFNEETFELFDDSAHEDGTLEKDGVFGNPLKDLLTTEGNYTFHFKAIYGEPCTATRELLWTLHVDVGIDPSRTDVTHLVTGERPDGKREVEVTFIPRDSYGSHIGPGRLDALASGSSGSGVTGAAGTTVTGPVKDNGDGSYTVAGVWDPDSSQSPGIVIGQAGRPPVVVHEPRPPVDEGRKWKLLVWVLLVLVVILLLLLLWLS